MKGYDACVIGSGAAGGVIAKELCEGGAQAGSNGLSGNDHRRERFARLKAGHLRRLTSLNANWQAKTSKHESPNSAAARSAG